MDMDRRSDCMMYLHTLRVQTRLLRRMGSASPVFRTHAFSNTIHTYIRMHLCNTEFEVDVNNKKCGEDHEHTTRGEGRYDP